MDTTAPRSPRFEHCYLHIGLDKTGTTSVQQAFAGEANALEAHCDLHFPHVFPNRKKFNGNHSPYLRPLFCEFPRARRRLSGMGLHTEEDIHQYNQITLETLQRGFGQTSARRVLFSAEVITHFQPDDLRGLADWARSIASRVTVIACVRHPVHALSSEIQQRLRIGAKLENLYAQPPHHHFRDKFTQLQQCFGEASVIAYSFHRATEHPRGLAAALLAELGIAADTLFSPEQATNTSMSREAAEQLSAYNYIAPAFIAGKANPERDRVKVRELAAIPGEPFRAPPEVAQRLAQITAEDVSWLEDHYKIDMRYEA